MAEAALAPEFRVSQQATIDRPPLGNERLIVPGMGT